MNIGFIASALKTQYFPPLDQFLAREAINYYYFGHVIAATIIQLSGTRATVGYNLQMANVLGLGTAEAFSLGAGVFWAVSNTPKHCLAKRALWAGVVSATFSMLLGNLHWLIYAPLRGKMYWFAEATRYIPNTIHEFPAYSFVVNDLHGHVSNIPTALWCVALAFLMFQTLAPAAASVSRYVGPGVCVERAPGPGGAGCLALRGPRAACTSCRLRRLRRRLLRHQRLGLPDLLAPVRLRFLEQLCGGASSRDR